MTCFLNVERDVLKKVENEIKKERILLKFGKIRILWRMRSFYVCLNEMR